VAVRVVVLELAMFTGHQAVVVVQLKRGLPFL
jgi:hypothetical protein